MREYLIYTFLLLATQNVFSQQIICEKTFGAAYNNEFINAIEKSYEGGVIISGVIISPDYITQILNVDINCDTIWTVRRDTIVNGDQDIKRTIDGNYVFWISGVGPIESNDLILQKIKPNGDTLWTRKLGLSEETERVSRLLQLSDGSFILSGRTSLNNGDYLVIKADNSGNQIWRKTFDWGLTDAVKDIVVSKNGNIVLAGVAQDAFSGVSHTRLVEINSYGDSIFSKAVKVAGPSYYENMSFTFNKITATKDGGFIYTGKLDSNSTNYAFVAKVNSAFNLEWKYIDNFSNNIFSKAYELADSSVILLVSKGIPPFNNQFFVYKFNKYGQNTNTFTFNSTECSQLRVTEMQYIGDSTFFVAGACLSNNNAYVAKLGKIGEPSIVTSTISPIEKDGDEWKVLVYPNPSSGIFNFKITGNNSKSYHLTLVNSVGQEAGNYSFSSKEFSIDVHLSGGIYFYLLSDEKGNVKRGKLIVE